MEHNHDLIVKYLQLISEQEQIINELSKSNKVLLNRNNELKNQKRIYKEAAADWKQKYETVRDCLVDLSSMIRKTDPNVERAIKIYKQNQGE